MIRSLLMSLLAGGMFFLPVASLTAQTSAPGSASRSVSPPVDPARLALAQPVVDHIWPLGTFRRVMEASMEQTTQAMLDQMYGMKAGELAGMAGTATEEVRKAAGDRTLGELASESDPAFRERMRITMEVMSREITSLMSRFEPQVRAAMAQAYARNFSAAQLQELGRFFATPTGAEYAAKSMTLHSDPAVLAAMQSFTPELLRSMPAIVKQVERATAHLPPPPQPKKQP